MADNQSGATIHLGLNSTAVLQATSVMLYPKEKLAKAAELMSFARDELKGVNPGIGFIGDPEWAIGGGLAVGLIAGLLSNAKAKRGVSLLQEAAAIQEQIIEEGVLFLCADVTNIERPFPHTWCGLHADGKERVVYGNTPNVSRDLEMEYVALSNDFALFEIAADLIWLRMSAIASYSIHGFPSREASRAKRRQGTPESGPSGLKVLK